MSNESEARANSRTTRQPRICRVIADHQALSPDPLSLRAGETLEISEKVDYWNGNPDWMWIWCTDQRGKSGWVPKDGIDFHANSTIGIARYDYAATELTVAVGDELVVEREESGWLWYPQPMSPKAEVHSTSGIDGTSAALGTRIRGYRFALAKALTTPSTKELFLVQARGLLHLMGRQ